MPRASHDGIELEYETFGEASDPPLLLVAGLGAQMVLWPDEFCEGMVDRGFFVIRFDNRDVGLSTKVDVRIDIVATLLAAYSGGEADAPYSLGDMADDAIAVLDALGIGRAHVVGVSMGGMIAQLLAIHWPERVQSLTLVMTTTGDADVGQPTPEVLSQLLRVQPHEREAVIDQAIETSRIIGSPDHFDEQRARETATRSYDRCFYPRGAGHQLLAIATAASRTDDLRKLDVNSLVIHGDLDPLIDVSGGERLAEVVPGAEFLVLEGMGHDLPTEFWTRVIEAITALAARSAT
jgi:pimeloyl-ACP methyl ester carboxylesterase